jgi:hypothetical protein
MKSYSGRIPAPAITAIECELTGLMHGTASITFHIRDGKLSRYETDKHISYIPEKPAGGERENTN